MRKYVLSFFPIIVLIFFLVSNSAVLAATLKGTVYNSNLDPEKNVLLEVNSIPIQKFLSVDGKFSFELSPGNYVISAKKVDTISLAETEIIPEMSTTDDVIIVNDGEFVYDLFLLPDLSAEEELLQESNQNLLADFEESPYNWAYIVAGILFIITLIRVYRARRKYGPLNLFRRKIRIEANKTLEQHKQELAEEPEYVDKALEIIKKHDGRINQKELRKEMLYLSEAKISLILTELEHKGKIEKIKKGRGNVIILK